MAIKAISPGDFTAIFNIMGLYQHLVDEGDEEGWTNLFTPDGEFHGLPPEFTPPGGFTGRETLKAIPRLSQPYGGKYRHHMGSFCVQYGASEDEAIARYYAMTAIAAPEGVTPHMFAVVRTHLVRVAGEWKIKSNSMNPL